MKRFAILFVAVVLSAGVARADLVTYDIDPAQTSLTMATTTAGQPGNPQAPGANVTSYTGTVQADLTGSTLTFAGGSSLDASLNPAAPFQPTVGTAGTAGTQDNYGFTTDLSVLGAGTVLSAIRDLVGDITAGSVSAGGSASGLTFAVTSGVMDAQSAIAGTGFVNLVGKSAVNGSAGNVSLVTVGDIETLTLPILLTLDTTANNVPASMTLSGQIVATRVIPEPATLSLLGLGALALLRRRRA